MEYTSNVTTVMAVLAEATSKHGFWYPITFFYALTIEMNRYGEKRLITVGIFRKTPYRSFIVNSLDFLPDEVEKVKTKNDKEKR